MIFLKIDFVYDENAYCPGIVDLIKSERCPLATSKTVFCLPKGGFLTCKRRSL